MQMNLTVNKPATTQLAGEAPVGLKIKVEDDKIMLKFVASEGGRDTFPLFERTRGGLGVTLKGALVDKMLSLKGMSRDTHMTMEPARYGWIVATPFAEGKPSKLVPTARLWRTRDEVQEKAAEPAPKAARAKASPASKPKADKPAAKKAAAKPAAKPAAKKAEAKPAEQKQAAKRPSKPRTRKAAAPQENTGAAKSDLPMPQAAEQAAEAAAAQ